jgi:hypothetical protein
VERTTHIRFRKEAEEAFSKLKFFCENDVHSDRNPSYTQILKSLEVTITNIKNNPNYGNKISRKYLNKNIINKYKTNKILRVELVGFWRLLYTLKGNEVEIIVIILDFMDHKEYSELFRYSKK